MKPETILWAKEAFILQLELTLDDPAHIYEEDDTPAYFLKIRAVAQDLGLDYDTLVSELGSTYEAERLRNIEKTA